MKIYYDENMPFAAELFAPLGEVTAFAGRDCTAQLIQEADVLLVRSITQVDQALLAGADKLKFVGTATIGTNHVDQAYLVERQIPFYSAPGCNAVSVAEYVLSALKVLEQRYLFSLQNKTIGIVGAGNTGTQLANKLTALGIDFLLCDPPLALAGDSRTLVSYQQLLNEADVISFHVPLTTVGDHPTYHLLGASELAQIKPDAVLINACRGEVFDNQMLLAAKQQGDRHPLVLDVWEGEPKVLLDLISYTDIATAHIAGYSFEGKARGTFMLYQALCAQLGILATQDFAELLPPSPLASVSLNFDHLESSAELDPLIINRLILLAYDVRADDAIFRQNIVSHGFDWIRKHYPIRREFSALTVFSQQSPSKTLTTVFNLGFKRGE